MSLSVPFFIVDYQSFDLILLPNVPVSVKSVKPIMWAESVVPGDHTKPLQFTGMGPQEITFTLDIVKKSRLLGAIPLIKQFEGLRVPAFGIGSLFGLTSNANPKVLFMYGSGNFLPQLYNVVQCDFENTMYNPLGYPQKSTITMALKLDEKSLLYTAEKFARVALRLLGAVDGIATLIRQIADGGERPYKGLL